VRSGRDAPSRGTGRGGAASRRAALRARATAELTAAGAHPVIDSAADLPEAVARIGSWLAEGRQPG
jgi:hypothetical protein